MPDVGRRLYHNALEMILSTANYKISRIKLGNILAWKNNRTFFFNIAGKNLPYYGRNGKEAFPWETHINPNRLDKIVVDSQKYEAEPWIAFCYAILDNKYKKYFSTIISMNNFQFGARLISVDDFRKNMQPRSPSWGVVELPRKKALQYTLEPKDI